MSDTQTREQSSEQTTGTQSSPTDEQSPQSQPFERHSFPNGLSLITKEVHSAPVVSFWVWYRVGARNEHEGITGISHWVEHMMFKGTRTLGKGQIMQQVAEHGGTLNAF